ncbi:hypothetical protein SLS53_008856 [Cytospora paraplurivora]|uniref:PKS/mFAS DH domain-containing protein n=1 Tax=Cytospora paraplurivora TaxID=2898453 RepID=A0AAN9YCF0_9PEZI
MIEANFKYYATSGKDTDVFKLGASGRSGVYLGQPCDTILPARPSQRQNLRAVSEEEFYESISELGYGYTGQFKALKGLKRKLGAAIGYIAAEPANLITHPAALDAAFSGRGNDAEDMEVIGPLYNLVLVRLVGNLLIKFEDLLQYTRDKTLAGLTNSNLPYPVLVEELGRQRATKYNPFFQVFIDYRMNQREKIQWAEGMKLQGMGFALNVPYDVYLDIIDADDGSCVHHLFLRKETFGEDEADKLAADYLRLMQVDAV